MRASELLQVEAAGGLKFKRRREGAKNDGIIFMVAAGTIARHLTDRQQLRVVRVWSKSAITIGVK